MRFLAAAALALVLPPALSCTAGDRPLDAAPPGPEITDSAGVRIVTHDAPGRDAPTFRLSASPRVSIGLVEGAPEYQLFRALSGTVLRDGTIAVANGGTSELRLYDAQGTYLRSIGRAGEGPGELSAVRLIGVLPGDSLVLFDTQQTRFSLFTLAGEFARSISARTEGSFGPPGVHGLLANRRILITPFTIPPQQPRPSVVRRPESVVWLALDDGGVTPFGEFPGTEVFSGPGLGGMPLVFGRGLNVAARGDRIAVANDDAYSIALYDAAGELVQVVRERRGPVPVDPGEWGMQVAPALRPGAPPGGPAMFRGNLEQQPHLTTRPPFGGNYTCFAPCLRFDQAGNLWVQEFDGTYEDDGSAWHVFDPEGVFTGVLVLPPRSSLLDAGAGWVLLNRKDDLDVEHVMLYELERVTGASGGS